MSASSPNDFLKRGSDAVRTALGTGGLVAVALGIFILLYPNKSADVAMKIVAVVIAIYALVIGIVYLSTAFFSKNLKGWARTSPILLGVIYVIAGIVLLANLRLAGAVIAIFLSITIGVVWLIEGVMAFVAMSRGGKNGWNIFYGVISIIAGLSLIIMPIAGAFTLWWLLGISLVVLGAVQIVRVLQSRRASV